MYNFFNFVYQKKTNQIFGFMLVIFILAACADNKRADNNTTSEQELAQAEEVEEVIPALDTLLYNTKINTIANGDTTGLWPVKNQPYPLPGAILPFKRVVAYYGNLYSSKMGILGEYPPVELWKRLNAEVKAWERADSLTAVQPAIHYIAVVAQGSPMKDGTYRTRMPQAQIDSALAIAAMGDAIVFLDIQVALSKLQNEVPLLEKYLMLPHVHLGIDPEFSMKTGNKPGTIIGTMDAADVNYCSEYLASLVKKHNLPPKILIVHRFTRGMLTNYRNIKLRPEVQIVINMDGWGAPALKNNTYRQYVYREPVHFTGYKLFYKNDLKNPPRRLLTPDELMKLTPQPVYIQYQ
jgi:hypothetical protein